MDDTLLKPKTPDQLQAESGSMRRLVRTFLDFMRPYWWNFTMGLTLGLIGIDVWEWQWWMVVLPTVVVQSVFSANS